MIKSRALRSLFGLVLLVVPWLGWSEQTVPAGIYARQYLEQQNLWARLKAKIVATDNVWAAFNAVESGNVEAGGVYKTDAAISKRVRITCESPHTETSFISYPVAALKSAPPAAIAKMFLFYLSSESAKGVFQNVGFMVLH